MTYLLTYLLTHLLTHAGRGLYPTFLLGRVIPELTFPPLFGLWLLALTQAPHGLPARAMCWRPLMRLGDWSFAWYCMHLPLIKYYKWARLSALQPWELACIYAMIVPLACLTFRFVEEPARIVLLRRLAPPVDPPHRAAIALAVTILTGPNSDCPQEARASALLSDDGAAAAVETARAPAVASCGVGVGVVQK